MSDLDPWLAFALGAVCATVLCGLAAALWWRQHRGAYAGDDDAAPPSATGEVGDSVDELTASIAEFVPLAFAPVQLLNDIVRAAVPEVRGLFAPGGQVALVFSDVVGSTEINGRLGDDAWSALVAEHDTVTEEVVRANRGRVVKRQGDGFMAAFHTARAAVAAAVQLGPALAARDGELGDLHLRVGVLVGEVVSRAGDYFGVNVAMAARVAAAAGPGEVLVSQAVVEALAGEDVPWQVQSRRNAEQLPGLPGEHRLAAVTG